MAVGAIISAVGKEATSVVEVARKSVVEKANSISENGVMEYVKDEIKKKKSEGEAVLEKLDEIKNMSPEQLREKLQTTLDEKTPSTNPEKIDEASEKTEDRNEAKEGLTDEQKEKIKEETGWSDEIIDYIWSWEEYEVYKKAGLKETEIGEKKCLIRDDIDWDQTDEKGRTNTERVKKGLAPLDKSGESIQLHHIGQHADSPLAESTLKEHRCKEAIKNKLDGLAREKKVCDELEKKYPPEQGYQIVSEVYLRNKDGDIVRDPVTGEARRVDFMVEKDGKVVDSIEVTSKTADKTGQIAKEERIRDAGGNYIRDNSGNLIEIPTTVHTRVERRD